MIILLSGFKHSGKDTFADLIKTELIKKEKKVAIEALAAKLKSSVTSALGVDLAYANDQDLKEMPVEGLVLTKERLTQILADFDSCDETIINKHIGIQKETVRKALQYVGTEVLRDLSSDIHCEMLDAKLNESISDVTIITDVRFINEQNYFNQKDQDVISIFVERLSKTPENTPDLHQSEKEMFEVRKMDHITVIENNGSLEALKEKAKQLVGRI
jgi:thymidylate kinase